MPKYTVKAFGKRTQHDVIADLAKALMRLTPVTACPDSWDNRHALHVRLVELLEELVEIKEVK